MLDFAVMGQNQVNQRHACCKSDRHCIRINIQVVGTNTVIVLSRIYCKARTPFARCCANVIKDNQSTQVLLSRWVVHVERGDGEMLCVHLHRDRWEHGMKSEISGLADATSTASPLVGLQQR